MPKIIENLRERLLAEAKRQVMESGYASTTVRSIAKACGVGTGTVYNYFESKDMLIASFVADDWRGCLAEMNAFESADCEAFFRNVHDCLRRFIERNIRLFSDKDASASYGTAFLSRHAQLRGQIAKVLAPVCCANGRPDPFFAEFAAESLLSWTSEDKSFEDQWQILKLLF